MKDWLRQYKPYVIFSAIILSGFLVFMVISAGLYPIASVNGHLVSARTFWKNYQADAVYYQAFLKSLGPDDLKKTGQNQPPNTLEIKRLVLTKLIEDVLISKEAQNELGNDLDSLVKSRIDKVDQNPDLQKAAEGIYGLALSDFKQEILVPLAKEEILTGRLFLKGQKFEDWLSDTKKTSHVSVFSSQFYWDGKEIQVQQ
ncbi:MAG: SurA N-terminal domain-containing protein [Candidatus Liptonbacteria bacterium]|nr:SurA N-terminal domain-containing protein [Candidatus Liptonbacteria bacterium]